MKVRVLITAWIAVAFLSGCATTTPPTPTAVSFSDDSFFVGGGAVVKGGHYIAPGTYATDGVGGSRCTWSRWWTPAEKFAGAGFVDGPMSVTTAPGQRFEVRGGCVWRTA